MAGAAPIPSQTSKKKAATHRKTNTVADPDFAFPQTVIDNAHTALRQASESKNESRVIQCAVQLVIANNQISAERMPQMAQLLDSLAQTSSPGTAAILYSLEAEMYNQMYNNDSWRYSQRELPLDVYPPDPQQWSEQLFAKKMLELVDKSLEAPERLNDIPSADYKAVLTDYNLLSQEYYPTLYSILATRSIEQLNTFANRYGATIPFGSGGQGESPAQLCGKRCNEIASQWYDYALQSDNVAQIAGALHEYINHTPGMTDESILNAYITAYEKYKASPYSADILNFAIYANYKSHPLQEIMLRLFPLLEECVKAHPDAPRTPKLINVINSIKSGSGKLTNSNLYSSAQDVVIKASSSNIPYDTNVCIYRVPAGSEPFKDFNVGKGKFVTSKTLPPSAKSDSVALNFGKLPVGQYVIIAGQAYGSDSTKYGKDMSSFKVTDFSFSTLRDRTTGKNMLLVVNPANGKPYSGQKVTFSSNRDKEGKTFTAYTNELGLVDFPKGLSERQITCTVRRGDDVVTTNEWVSNYRYDEDTDIQGILLTDLAIYHPGDTCQFSAITYSYNPASYKRTPLTDTKLKALLYNASMVKCDTVTVTTDAYGRATGKFILPKGGMNGDFYIHIKSEIETICSTSIRVEDYKQPSFFVELNKIDNIVAGEPLKVSGKVMTYSGMPVAEAQVKLSVKMMPLWWTVTNNGSYATTVRTDSEGKFSLELTTDRLRDTTFENQRYSLDATATSTAGESQMSETKNVYIGSKMRIHYAASDTKFCADKPTITIDYSVIGGKGEHQPLEYSLKDSAGAQVAAGLSPSASVILETASLPSGTYTLTVSADDASSSDRIILYRATDTVPPMQTPLWLPTKNITAAKGAKAVTIPVGSALSDTNIFYTVSNEKGIVKQGLLLPEGRMTHLSVIAPEGRNERVWATFYTMDSCESYIGTVTLIPAVALENIEVEKLSFRDKIFAGGKERWTFRYTLSDQVLPSLPVVATMTDKSLNAITPFSWRVPYKITPDYTFSLWSNRDKYDATLDYYYSYGKNRKATPAPVVNIDTYGYPLYNLYGNHKLYMRGAKRESAKMPLFEAVETAGNSRDVVVVGYGVNMDYASQVGAVEEESDEIATEGGTPPTQDKGEYRPAQIPLAWFKPNLCTDSNGVLELSFEAPNYNTTWQLQMLGYNSELLANRLIEDIVASKPVMVSTNAPRFLRTGDRVLLMATVYNNTDSRSDVAGRMEIFNPLDNSVIAFEDFPAESTSPRGSRLITIEFTAPSDIEFIGFRTLGTIPGFSDGEQSLIAICPSSSPVTESYPFYLAPASNTYSLQLPKFNADAQVSLQYCDNPVWECVTALPDMSFDKNASILSTANQLYGNAVAAGLMKQYPQLAQAVSLWSETYDLTLVSNLEKNPELKIVALSNTPWVLNAQAETLRKSRLINLLNDENCTREIAEALERLKSQQTKEGGWSWCPAMKPSMYITAQVLWRLAMLSGMGYLDNSAMESSIKSALHFCESELYSDYTRARNTFSTTQLLNYLYIRSFFPQISMSANFKSLKTKAMQAIKAEWKDFSIYNKATAATLLYREQNPMEARTVLESLSQLASNSPERGMWFDNLRSGFFSDNTVITTAQALEAYNEITPQSPAIDRLRQWLIIERQAQDWGRDAQLAEVVYAILTSGSDWTTRSEPAKIYIDNREIKPADREALTGAFTIALDPAQADGATLRIEKFGQHQAWGGIVAKYIAPIESVREFSESDVTISKRILIVDETENGISVKAAGSEPLKVGQRIRIQLTVTSARDIDYAVITDERGGFMAPVEQLSKYVWQDGIGYYREVKNSSTNLFIPRLPKGDFLVEYDCFVSQEGSFATGIATLQSLYAPSLSAHSAGAQLSVTAR